MKRLSYLLLLFIATVSYAQSSKPDTVQGVVVYTGYADLRFVAKGDFHTYTVRATQVKSDTGIIYVKTEFGYLDLKKNYQFIPMNKLQPAHLRHEQ